MSSEGSSEQSRQDEVEVESLPTGYWKTNSQHNFRLDYVGVQLWIRFRHTDRETRLYGDVFKR
jgi:hypothetical protein